MTGHRIFATSFASIYPLYVQKAERKNRSRDEVDEVISWLTGYDAAGLERAIAGGIDLETFFEQAPALNPNASLITGMICGYRVEEIDDPLMQKIRYLDKLVDELARGKKMASILRSEPSASSLPTGEPRTVQATPSRSTGSEVASPRSTSALAPMAIGSSRGQNWKGMR